MLMSQMNFDKNDRLQPCRLHLHTITAQAADMMLFLMRASTKNIASNDDAKALRRNVSCKNANISKELLT